MYDIHLETFYNAPHTRALSHFSNCRNQRNKLTLDNLSLPSPDKSRPLRHQYSTDNVHIPTFNIPNLRIEQRKTSSAEDMARKNSIGTSLDKNIMQILLSFSTYSFSKQFNIFCVEHIFKFFQIFS